LGAVFLRIVVTLAVVTLGSEVRAGSAEPFPADRAARRRAQLEDLELAKANYILKSQAFSGDARKRALELTKVLGNRAGTLSSIEFLVGIQKLSALADNGHDGVKWPKDAWRPPTRLPLRLIWFPDGMLVARAAPKVAELLGARVVSIEGRSPDQLLSRLRVVVGGSAEYRTWNALWAIECGGVLHALGLAKAPDRLRLQLALMKGGIVERTVATIPSEEIPTGVEPSRLWSPAPFPGEPERDWRTAVELSDPPLYLQHPDELFFSAPLPDLKALYVQFRMNISYGSHAIEPFVEAVRKELETKPPENLILDQRFNTGGSIDLTRDLMRAIAAKIGGRIYLLVGRYTFSAGIVSAAALKHDGADRVIVVGEDIGDRLQFWSETHHPVCLPHSRLCLLPTVGFWDLQHGCKGKPGCYGDKFDARVDSLKPQLRAPLTAADWLGGRDPGMEAVSHDLARR
jgi:hypothetical protein